MSVDLDDPWAEDLAAGRRTLVSTRGGSARGRSRAVSAPHPSSDTDFDSWSPTSPFTPLDDEKRQLPAASGEPRSVTSSSPSGTSSTPNKTKVAAGPSTRTRVPRRTSHPLAPDMLNRLSITSDTDVSDVSRPALKRVTSITERQVAESQSQNQSRAESRCGSEVGSSSRGSIDLAHAEVEVIVHQVKPNESIAGIALRYGVELAILRRANKLWPSDPVHLRTHLYVPLDACKPTSKGDQIVRGPGAGQVTIMPRRKQPNGTSTTVSVEPGHNRCASAQSWHSGKSLNGTIKEGRRPGTPDTVVASTEGGEEVSAQVLDIVCLPASKLRFFPRAKRENPRARASLDSDIGRSADSVRTLSTIERQRRREARTTERENLGRSGGIFAPLGALTAAAEAAVAPPKKNIVRLRPPQAPTPVDDSFTGQLRSLFTVPPPPVYPVPTSRPRVLRPPRAESGESQSDSGLVASQVISIEDELEMNTGPWRNALATPPRTLRKTDKKRD